MMGHQDLAQIEAEIEHLALPKQFLLIERLAKRLRQEFILLISPSGEHQLLEMEWIAQRLRDRIHAAVDPLDIALDAMAADPEIQHEMRFIEAEFGVAELDGLGDHE